MTEPSPRWLPALGEPTRPQLTFYALSIGMLWLLLGALAWRVAIRLDLWGWWMPLAAVGGVAAADFGSGLVHWGADTWGRDDCPLIGRRLLMPFRVHHVNPDDFLRRRFLETNGDVAFVAAPVAGTLLSVPLDVSWGLPLAVFGFAFCAVGSMTNQIHQWSHLAAPPPPARVLQACRLLLGRAEHAAHHLRPYDCHYCITTGWCNRPLEAIAFFRRLEVAITRLTGLRPRGDDQRYELTFGVAAGEAETPCG